MPESLKPDMVFSETWIQAIEPLLAEGHEFQFSPSGMSMFPFLMGGRDVAIVKAVNFANLKRGHIVLYQRDNGELIIHRIYKRKENAFFLIGDNETTIEGPIYSTQIKASTDRIIRNGKEISCSSRWFKILSELWLQLRYLRPHIVKIRKLLYRKYNI